MEQYGVLPYNLEPVTKLGVGNWDTICIIDSNVPSELFSVFKVARASDQAFDSEINCFKIPLARIVYAPIGKLHEYDDVRVFECAASKAIARAVKAGAKTPIIVLPIDTGRRKHCYAAIATILGALHELYVPIQLREDDPAKGHGIKLLGVYSETNPDSVKGLIKNAIQYERSLYVARDIGGGDPERMTPIRVEQYVTQLFGNSLSIKMKVVDDPNVLTAKYPLFQAVNRAAGSVPRHNGRIIFLEYSSPKPARKTLMLVGKGVTYDTGGADIKAGGVMATMSRDKCGAAAVAGFMQYVESIQPKDINVIGVLCMVRNSVGEECYVSDEVITSRAGVRVRVGNTDAEGRMCMADALCEMKELALTMPDPHLYTIATLTGHAYLTHGVGYSIVMDNSPAVEADHARQLKRIGDEIGNPFEISTIQREDFDFHKGVCLGEDVVQANNLPSSRTNRGHQGPAAFMMLSSGLDNYGYYSSKPIKYSHLDIAGSAGEFPYPPTGAPILALIKLHFGNEY